MNPENGSATIISPLWLGAVRVIWILLLVLSLGLFIIALPTRYAQLSNVTLDADTRVGELRPEDALALEEMGLSPQTYASYFTTLEALSALPFLLVASLIFARRPDDWVALAASMTGILMGTMTVPVVNALPTSIPAMEYPVLVLRMIGISGFVITFYVFPDGRFVPRWIRWLILIWIAFAMLTIAVPSLKPPAGIASIRAEDIPVLLVSLGFIGTAAFTQVYRYRYYSTPEQRQQTKWIVYGSVMAVSLLFLAALPNIIYPELREPGVLSMQVRFIAVTITLVITLPLIPIAVGFSILRYRLWDIDILIQRTMLYSSLTVTLGLVFFGSVVLLQELFRSVSGQDSPIAIVVSTLAIAALFNPLRARLQDFIDRRFYRNRYDAEKALRRFANYARVKTDLDELRAELVRVVQETVQPQQVSVWLKGVGKDDPRLNPSRGER